MDKKITFLTPIEVKEPPYHTKIVPRCFTCAHFPVCTELRDSYLKTALLIENVLGNPQQDLLLQKSRVDVNCGCYKGNPIEDASTIFEQTLQFSKRTLPTGEILTDIVEGTFYSALYQTYDIVLFKYESEGYQIVFKAIYNEETKEFDIGNGTEIVYGIIYEFPSDNVLELQVNLEAWRSEMIAKEEAAKNIDIINTTYFSAILNCDFYEQLKGISVEEGIRRIIARFPEGVPCGEGQYYHLETLHIEPNKIPWYNPNAGKIAFSPMPYPVFVPKKCKPKKLYRRDDLRDDDF